MANQIATFFRSYPEDEAVSGVRRHLHAFWTPVMIATLREHLASMPSDADRLVREAFVRDPKIRSPVERALSPTLEAGPIASDAG